MLETFCVKKHKSIIFKQMIKTYYKHNKNKFKKANCRYTAICLKYDIILIFCQFSFYLSVFHYFTRKGITTPNGYSFAVPFLSKKGT